MTDEKYALLDTDFISKMHLIRKDDQNKLIDKVMAMPKYRFLWRIGSGCLCKNAENGM